MLIKWLPRGAKVSHSMIESRILNNNILISELSKYIDYQSLPHLFNPPILFLDRKIIDTRKSFSHQTVFIKFP